MPSGFISEHGTNTVFKVMTLPGCMVTTHYTAAVYIITLS